MDLNGCYLYMYMEREWTATHQKTYILFPKTHFKPGGGGCLPLEHKERTSFIVVNK